MRETNQKLCEWAIIGYFCKIVYFKVLISENLLIPICSFVQKCPVFCLAGLLLMY